MPGILTASRRPRDPVAEAGDDQPGRVRVGAPDAASTLPAVLVAAAFCPCPPILVPALAAGAAAELDGVRAACAAAVDRLLAAGPEAVHLIGVGPRTQRYHPADSGSLAGFGVPVRAGLGRSTCAGGNRLPPSLVVGAWLLRHTRLLRFGHAVPADADDAARDAVAVRVTGARRPVGLLVLGDGSACRTERSPLPFDPRAVGFDGMVADALRTGDAAALRDLDPVLGGELAAAGVPAWRVAGAAVAAAGRGFDAELLADVAPYGVGYVVASWVARPPGPA